MPNFKMIGTILKLLVLLPINLLGQSAQIDTLTILKNEKSTNLESDKLKFPIIKTSLEKIDFSINSDLKIRFMGTEFQDEPLDSTITKWADESISFLDFQVTYNEHGILSLNISAEGCGANCTVWTEYYNYSTITGKTLGIEEIVDIKRFKPMVVLEKDKQYDQQRAELKNTRLDNQAEVDNETYEAALEYYNSCDTAFDLETFALHNSFLEIVSKCDLPRAFRNLTPIIELKYKYKDIKKLLKVKIL